MPEKPDQGEVQQEELKKGMITFLETQITTLGQTAPQWLRAIVYFMMVVTFIIVLFRVLGGEYSIAGQLVRPASHVAANRVTGAVGWEVQIADHAYSPNSHGEYFAVVRLRTYLRTVATGTIDATLFHNGVQYTDLNELTYLRKSGRFRAEKVREDDDETTVQTEPAAAPPRHAERAPLDWSLVPSAYAGFVAVPSNRMLDRLVVEAVKLPMLKEAADTTMTLTISGATYELQRVSAPRAVVRVPPKSLLDLGSEYYFQIPRSSKPVSGTIELRANTGVFFDDTVKVPVTIAANAYGAPQTLKIADGTTLQVRLMSPFDFVFFDRVDVAKVARAVSSDLQSVGVRVVVFDAPLGDSSPTNALFIGSDVPSDVAQRVVSLLAARGVRLSVIKRKASFKTGNNLQMELGSQRSMASAPKLTPQQIQAIFASN